MKGDKKAKLYEKKKEEKNEEYLRVNNIYIYIYIIQRFGAKECH